MQRDVIRKVTNILPDMIKEVSRYIKTNFNATGQKALLNAGGTVGLVIRLFGHSLIQSYFDRMAKRKLDDYGTRTYLTAAFEQAEKSLKYIKDKIENEDSVEDAFAALEKAISKKSFDYHESDILVVFQPKYHPAVLYVKKSFNIILDELNISQETIDEFVKHYNSNIGLQVKRSFGEDWEEHLEDISEMRLSELETEFLWDMKSLGKIGFKSNENLKYETTYAKWCPIENFRETDDIDLGESNMEEEEAMLEPVERLIEDYFNYQPNNNINKVLFILGDFGKGKSVFLRQYASQLAKNYLETGEGQFPVYFNLSDFKNYSSEFEFGVVADYLLTEYGIRINDTHFINKNYVFLIDSLDESGDLSQNSIDKVLSSVKAIQSLDKTKFRTNRMIITSRPFDGGLYSQLKNHQPHVIKNGFGRNVEYFVSLYGFTKLQFNNWMIDSLFNYPKFKELETSSLTRKIQESVDGLKYIDVYNELLLNDTLSRSELRRPIFAYMIFKLLLNNIDFFKVGKIGVYLSFINLLTKEAKYIEDETHVDLKSEFEFRNILHSISALTMFEWQKNKKLELKKADICRMLDGERTKETDTQILERYKNNDVIEIQFLSHSYFGENNNILHFQHKSFSEILLAEYYLKVFIKYALDEDFDVAQARIKLSLGQPSAQTIQFLVEMLRLLRSAASGELSEKIIQKRKLLFPLMASLSTKKHNNLFCHDIYYEWYKKFKIQTNVPEYPEESVTNWYFTQEKIDKIIDLAKSILESDAEYLLVKGDSNTALFDKEVFEIQGDKFQTSSINTDKWLALLFGNILYNNESKQKYFNSSINKFEMLFEMIRNWNFYSTNDSAPFWAKSLFKGIKMDKNIEDFNFSHSNISGINFSHSSFKNINLSSSKLSGCIFKDVSFQDVDFSFSDLCNAQFKSIRSIAGNFDLGFSLLSPEVFLPPQLAKKFFDSGFMGNQKSYIPEAGFSTISQLFNTLEGIIEYGIINDLFSKEECPTWFQFETMHMEGVFERKLSLFEKDNAELVE